VFRVDIGVRLEIFQGKNWMLVLRFIHHDMTLILNY
jgi:hypothetical protein